MKDFIRVARPEHPGGVSVRQPPDVGLCPCLPEPFNVLFRRAQIIGSVSWGPFGRKCPNQCLDRLAGFPGSDGAVARDEHGKVNFGCDDHAAAPPSVASGVPEAAAGVSRAGAVCPTGCADKPSGTGSYGGARARPPPPDVATSLQTPATKGRGGGRRASP